MTTDPRTDAAAPDARIPSWLRREREARPGLQPDPPAVPCVEAAARLDRLRERLLSVTDAGRLNRLPRGLVAEFEEAVLAAADAVDPLRVLLADDEKAIEFLAKARHEAKRAADRAADRQPLDAWEWLPEGARAHRRLIERAMSLPVLAALRSVGAP